MVHRENTDYVEECARKDLKEKEDETRGDISSQDVFVIY